MPPREPSAVRPPACKLLGFPALSNDNSRTQLIALSTAYPWYSLNTALQSAAPYKITKRDKTKHRYDYFTSMTKTLYCCAGGRTGVYTPPPGLLSWLSSQPSISEEESGEPEDLPWPFNEQAHLRKSLSEIHQAQQSAISEPTCGSEALREGASIPPNSPGRPFSPSTPLYTAHLKWVLWWPLPLPTATCFHIISMGTHLECGVWEK